MPNDILVLVNYNGEKLLPDCLKAVAAQTRRPSETLVLDNASSDGSVTLIRKEFPWVTVLEAGKNLGFAGGNNAAVRLRPEAKFVALMNTDALPDRDWYAELLKPLEAPVSPSEKQIAISWSNVIPPDENNPQRTFNSTISPLGYTVRNQGAPNFIFYASGSAMAYRKDLLGEPFLDEYFMYYEDLQLSWRARLSGFEVVRVPNAKVIHFGSATTKRYRSRKTVFYQQRNRLLTLLLSFRFRTLFKLWPLLEADFWFNLLLGIIHPARSAIALLDAHLWLIKNVRRIHEWRDRIEAERKIEDAEILSLLLPGPTDGTNRTLGIFVRTYCRLLGIRLAD